MLAVAQDAKKDDKPIDEAKLREKVVSSSPFIQGKLTAHDVDGDEKKFTIQYVHQRSCRCAATSAAATTASPAATCFPCRYGISLQRLLRRRRSCRIEME